MWGACEHALENNQERLVNRSYGRLVSFRKWEEENKGKENDVYDRHTALIY